MKMQKSALKLDAVMRKMVQDIHPDKLSNEPKWQKMLSLRQSLQTLLPEGHPGIETFAAKSKRVGVTMDFNGIQVTGASIMFSFPQVLRE